MSNLAHAIRELRPSELTPQQRAHWEQSLDESPALFSPFLRPEFVAAAAAAGLDARIAAWESHRGWNFLPFQAARNGVATTLAPGLGEWQAVVGRTPRVPWRELLTALRWRAFHFDHFVPSQLDGANATLVRGESPFIDLSGGYEAYCRRRKQLGGGTMSKTQRKARKLAREVGPLEFDYDAPLELVMQCLLDWKGQQHRRTGVPDVFQRRWVVALLREVAASKSAEFAGIGSVLKAGGRPVAVHLGMRTRRAAHMWYPAYNIEFHHYSPGIALILQLCQALAADGVRRLDFGPGGQRYKNSLKTDDTEVALGVVDAHAAAAVLRRSWQSLRQRLKASPLRAMRPLAQSVRRWIAPSADSEGSV